MEREGGRGGREGRAIGKHTNKCMCVSCSMTTKS